MNERLKQAIKLDQKVAIYIPGTINGNEHVNNDSLVKAAAKMLSNAFGGATAINTNGYWLSDEYGLIEENTIVVYAFCTAEAIQIELNSIVDWVRDHILIGLNQESASIEVNGTLYIM